MSKQNLAHIDKRIRSRHYNRSDADSKQLQAELDKLPDHSDNYDVITIAQPAVGGGADADAEAGDDAPAN